MSSPAALITEPEQREDLHRTDLPALQAGDRLGQPEFHRRYEAMPPGTRAELIGGIVYIMPSPLKNPHGGSGRKISALLGAYEAATPGITGADNATVILGPASEPQPDHVLRIEHYAGGATRVNDSDYIVGPPELIFEVAHTSEGIDLHDKKRDYRKAGVREYYVLMLREKRLAAFDLPKDREMPLPADGMFKSAVFPGLWIDAAALIAGELPKLLRGLKKGLRSSEHAAFVKKLAAMRPRKRR